MGKNILITGGAGFIGSNLALKLLSKKYNVFVLDNLSPQIHGNNPQKTSPLYQSILGKVTFFHGDVCNRSDLKKALNKMDTIVHLAAETGTGQSMYAIQKYTNVNIGSTALLLDILANEKHCIKKIVVASSRAIYGEGKYFSKKYGDVFPLQRIDENMKKGFFECCFNDDDKLDLVATTEDSKIHPTSVYGITKQVQEQLVMSVCPNLGIDPVAFRYQNVYGPGQSLQNPYTGILSIFSTRILNENNILVFEDGKESRDFVYIDDVISATVLGIEKDVAGGNVFNVGTGKATSVLNVAETLIKAYQKKIPIQITGNYRIGDIRHNFADINLSKKILGFEPKYSFEMGIKKFVDWVKTQDVQKDFYETSIEEMKLKGLYK